MSKETILVLDFGGQYNQLIARRVREAKVYCEILPFHASIDRIREKNPKGIIFTGSPASVDREGAPKCSPEVFELGVPILGICYGTQLMSRYFGGTVAKADQREYGKAVVKFDTTSPLFRNTGPESVCWMSHTYQVESLPEGFRVIASTDTCPVAAMENADRKFYGVQFHPEVVHTQFGDRILKNFLYDICGCTGEWTMANFVQESVKALKERIGDRKVLCALSGGVDSSVAAVLVHKAVGDNLTCIFVDHGLLRKDEGDQVEKVFREQFRLNLIRVNAEERFLNRLKDVTEPEA